jgi:hypothetical protein
MERLMKGRTTFMIAHRLGTLANCDVRIEIEAGRVIKFEAQGPDASAESRGLSERSTASLLHPDLLGVSPSRPEESARLFRDMVNRHWDVDLDFRLQGLPLVERLFAATTDGNRRYENPPVPESLVVGLGCFVGETIRRNAEVPGSWFPAEDWSEGPVIKFEDLSLDPIGKARAFLREGSGDSVTFYADFVLQRLKWQPQEHERQSISSSSAGSSYSLAADQPMSNGITRR